MRDNVRRRGMTLIFVAATFFVLLIVAAWVIDWGFLTFTKHQLQNFVDAAALAGAQDLPNLAQARQSALTAYARNYADNFNLPTLPTPQPIVCTDPVSPTTLCYRIGADEVQVTTPYAPDNAAPSPNRIHVRACRQVRLYFAPLLGTVARRVCAESTARKSGSVFPRGVIILDNGGGRALQLQGNAALTVANGSVHVNSSAPDALFAQGNAVLTAQQIQVTGNYRREGNAMLVPTPAVGQSPTPDPLSSLQPPNPSSLPVFTGRTINGIATLSPGIYTGPIRLEGNAFVTLQPGVYILRSGLLVSGNAQLVGSGVTLFNESGQIEVQGNGALQLSPPTDGPFAGITVFQPATNISPLWLSGNASFQLQGAVYLPRGVVHLEGSGMFQQSMVVAWRMELSGNAVVALTAQEPPAADSGAQGLALEN